MTVTLNSGTPPVANFSGTPTSGNAPLNVSFTDSSTNSPTSWSWTFGDGGSSTAQNPSHTYSAAGTYSVSLTATNSGGSSSPYTQSNYITVNLPAPVANFSGTPTSGAASLNVTFTDSSTNSPTSWSWTFGDGGSSTAQNPSHTYTTAGNYTVSLTATNSTGSSSPCTKTAYITVTAVLYPTSVLFQGTLASGSDSNLTAPDGVYEVYNSSTDFVKSLCVDHIFTTSYTASQIASMKIEYLLHDSLTTSYPSTTILAEKTDASWDTAVNTFIPGTTDQWYSWTTTNVSTYLNSYGTICFRTCCCGRDGGQTYTFSYDCVRLTLTLN